MKDFLRANWVWIVAPIVVVAIAFALLTWLNSGGETAPMNYPTF